MEKTISQKVIKSVSAVDQLYQPNRAANFYLFISLNRHTISYTVYDNRSNTFVALESFVLSDKKSIGTATLIDAIIDNDSILKNIFRGVYVSIVNGQSTLIPNPLYEKGKEKLYLEFTQPLPAKTETGSYALKALEAKVVYGYDSDLIPALKKHFPNLTLLHHSIVIIEGLLNNNDKIKDSEIVIHFQPEHFELICFKSNKLQFYNSFKHETSEDFIYYILYTAEQLKINTKQTEIILYGEVDKESAAYTILSNYFSKINFGKRNPRFEYSGSFISTPEHHYFNLFNQLLCV